MKKSKILFTLIACLLLSHLHAQIWIIGGKDIYGNGIIKTTTLPISNFNHVKVIGNIEVVFDTSLNAQVKIEAEENIIPYIKIKANRSGRLTIKNPVKHQLITTDKKRIKVSIPYHPLEEVSLSGRGYINLLNTKIKSEDIKITLRGSGSIKLNLETSNLEAKISGSGRVTLNGMATNTNLTIRGGGRIYAQDMKTRKGTINLSGEALIKVMEKSSYDISKRDYGRVISAKK